jgi:hypothetical protein
MTRPRSKRTPRRRYVQTGLSGPVTIQVGTRLYHLPANALFRFWRGEHSSMLAYVLSSGTVHLLSAQGEILLSPAERERLASTWETIPNKNLAT